DHSEIEGSGLTAIDYTLVFSFAIEDTFTDNASMNFATCRYGKISRTTSLKSCTITSGNQIIVDTNTWNSSFGGGVYSTLSIDSNSDACGAVNSTIQTYTNSGTHPVTINVISANSWDSRTT